jgi:hypothetical protein
VVGGEESRRGGRSVAREEALPGGEDDAAAELGDEGNRKADPHPERVGIGEIAHPMGVRGAAGGRPQLLAMDEVVQGLIQMVSHRDRRGKGVRGRRGEAGDRPGPAGRAVARPQGIVVGLVQANPEVDPGRARDESPRPIGRGETVEKDGARRRAVARPQLVLVVEQKDAVADRRHLERGRLIGGDREGNLPGPGRGAIAHPKPRNESGLPADEEDPVVRDDDLALLYVAENPDLADGIGAGAGTIRPVEPELPWVGFGDEQGDLAAPEGAEDLVDGGAVPGAEIGEDLAARAAAVGDRRLFGGEKHLVGKGDERSVVRRQRAPAPWRGGVEVPNESRRLGLGGPRQTRENSQQEEGGSQKSVHSKPLKAEDPGVGRRTARLSQVECRAKRYSFTSRL